MDILTNIKNSILSIPADQRQLDDKRLLFFHYRHFVRNFFNYLINDVFDGKQSRLLKANLRTLFDNNMELDAKFLVFIDDMHKLCDSDEEMGKVINIEIYKWITNTSEIIQIEFYN
jgi:predicted phosphatase